MYDTVPSLNQFNQFNQFNPEVLVVSFPFPFPFAVRYSVRGLSKFRKVRNSHMLPRLAWQLGT